MLAALAFFTVFFGWLDVPDSSTEDLLYHRASGTSPQIKIITIDDQSLSALGSYGEWDRGMYTRLVETLCVSDEIKPAYSFWYSWKIGGFETVSFSDVLNRITTSITPNPLCKNQ